MKTLLMTIPVALLPTVFWVANASQAPASRPTSSIGYVSAQRIFVESTDGKALTARMQTLQQQKNSELRTKQQTLEATRRQLAQTGDVTARVQLQQQEQQQRTDLERSGAQAQTELQTLQRELQAEILGRVKPAVEDVAKSQNIQLVLNSDTSVVWSAPGADLTSAVIERLNKAAPKP